MRCNSHIGRAHADGRLFSSYHNDRARGAGSRVDAAKSVDNWYRVYDIAAGQFRKLRPAEYDADGNEVVPAETFDSVEHDIYAAKFSERLAVTNAKYEARRQYKYCKSVDDYRRSKNSAPEEMELKIGNKADAVSADDLRRAVKLFIHEYNERWGSHVIPLNIAVHVDEAGAVHGHFRYVYAAESADGLYVCKSKALAALGYSRPDESKSEGRYNHPGQAHIADMHALWRDCIERVTAYHVERVPVCPGKRTVELAAWQCARDEARAAEARSEVSALASDAASLSAEVSALSDEKKRLTGVLAPLRHAAGCVSDMLADSRNPVIAYVRNLLDEFAHAYDDVRNCDAR